MPRDLIYQGSEPNNTGWCTNSPELAWDVIRLGRSIFLHLSIVLVASLHVTDGTGPYVSGTKGTGRWPNLSVEISFVLSPLLQNLGICH